VLRLGCVCAVSRQVAGTLRRVSAGFVRSVVCADLAAKGSDVSRQSSVAAATIVNKGIMHFSNLFLFNSNDLIFARVITDAFTQLGNLVFFCHVYYSCRQMKLLKAILPMSLA